MDLEKTVSFLKNLKKNNNKEWFEAHRAEYTELRESFYNLLSEIQFLCSPFDKSFELYNPRKIAYRINRDIRFSKDKSPYKSEFGALFAKNKDPMENGYHFHIDHTGTLHIGAGVFPESKVLKRFKEKLVEDPDPFLEILYNKKFEDTFKGLWQEQKYKRIPAGFEDYPELADILKLKTIFAYKGFEFDEIKNVDLAEFISKKFKILYPLVQYLKENL